MATAEAGPVAEAASSRTALVRRARRVNAELARLYPDAHIELNFTTPLELLVAAILSARSTDRLVNQVTPVLFGRYGTAADYADPDKIERDLAALLPRQEWTAASHRLIWHGRRVCHARRPACGACGVARWCPSFGAGPTDEATARKLVKTGPFS
jgi:endonuclease III